MHFFDIPEEVIAGGICARLACNDLLRLRRVSKQLKYFVDEHFRARPLTLSQEFEINETDKPLQRYIDLELEPRSNLTRFYLNTKSATFFTDHQSDIDKFLEKYGQKITHLRVRLFHTFAISREMEFYQVLSNLKHLELEETDATSRECRILNAQRERMYLSPFPPNFKELETLKFGLIRASWNMDNNYQWDFFDHCEKLVYFKHALYENLEPLTHSHPGGIFGSLPEAIPARLEKFPNGPHLKYYDIENMEQDDCETGSFYMVFLLEVCLNHDVKLLNVDASMLSCICSRMKDELGAGKPIHSLRNIRANLFFLEMPELEKITITGISACSMADDRLNYHPKWPKLKILNVNVDSITEEQRWGATDATQLIDYIFDREESLREHLTELSLRFAKATPLQSIPIPYPDAACIIATCPNLTKLTLANYPHSAPNKAFSLLWKGLKFLEEVCIEDSPALANSAFVGKNVESPVFLQLTSLRKLTLRNLDKMTKITDTLFNLVLRHMKLTHLVLQSDEPVTSITTGGVSGFLTGEFAESIEKFPFQGTWSISGVSDEEFNNLASQFRSSDLLF